MRLCVIVLTLFEFSVWNSYPTYCLSLNTKYLFYGVNKHEGFNLRRDVYIRIANLVRVLRDPSQYPLNALHRAAFRNYNWILVLPPWSQAFHWDGVSAYPWSTFF
uniref:peptide-O-fucosyltransferase n=1 Tax=Mesocestoides corti TaxID=53468 RepID=A0A5K3FZI6_MESCO